MARVVLFSGHMIDSPERGTPRFPPALEPAVGQAIRVEVNRLNLAAAPRMSRSPVPHAAPTFCSPKRFSPDNLSEFGSVRQVLMWLRDERVALPTRESERPRAITWRLPTYRMVLLMVHSPFYAGAYASGRRESRTRVVDGRATRTSGHHKPMARWTALIRDHPITLKNSFGAPCSGRSRRAPR
jgi:hypothetical protein